MSREGHRYREFKLGWQKLRHINSLPVWSVGVSRHMYMRENEVVQTCGLAVIAVPVIDVY